MNLRIIGLMVFLFLHADIKAWKKYTKFSTVQIYGGFSTVNFGGPRMNSLQTGLLLMPYYSNFFMAVENNFSYSTRTYDWPGVAKYKYVRTYNNLGAMFGVQVGRGYRFSANFAKYHRFAMGVTPVIRMNYRVWNRSSVYLNINWVHMGHIDRLRLMLRPVIGVGASYDLYELEF